MHFPKLHLLVLPVIQAIELGEAMPPYKALSEGLYYAGSKRPSSTAGSQLSGLLVGSSALLCGINMRYLNF